MMRTANLGILAALALPALVATAGRAADNAHTIDRQALVTRHNVVLEKADPQTALQVGNGEFAFGVDVTGLQTFYGNTMSHWGWHSFPVPMGKRIEDLKLTNFDTHGRTVGYPTSGKGQEDIYRWLRENPHRFNLGRLALRLTTSDGKTATLQQIQHVRQELDLWRGLIVSQFAFEGKPVRVETCADPAHDAVAVRIESPLVADGRLSVELGFPYGSPQSSGADWNQPDAHCTRMTLRGRQAEFERQLDNDQYAVRLTWAGQAKLHQEKKHTYVLRPDRQDTVLELVCTFAPAKIAGEQSTFTGTKECQCGALATVLEQRRRHRPLGQHRIPAGKNLSGGSCSRSICWPFKRPVPCRRRKAACSTTAGTASSTSKCTGGTGRTYALWDRWPLFERSLGWYGEFSPRHAIRPRRRATEGARWPRWSAPRDAIRRPGLGRCWSGSSRIRSSTHTSIIACIPPPAP